MERWSNQASTSRTREIFTKALNENPHLVKLKEYNDSERRSLCVREASRGGQSRRDLEEDNEEKHRIVLGEREWATSALETVIGLQQAHKKGQGKPD